MTFCCPARAISTGFPHNTAKFHISLIWLHPPFILKQPMFSIWYDGVGLQSQASGGRDRKVVSPRLDYIAKPWLEGRKRVLPITYYHFLSLSFLLCLSHPHQVSE